MVLWLVSQASQAAILPAITLCRMLQLNLFWTLSQPVSSLSHHPLLSPQALPLPPSPSKLNIYLQTWKKSIINSKRRCHNSTSWCDESLPSRCSDRSIRCQTARTSEALYRQSLKPQTPSRMMYITIIRSLCILFDSHSGVSRPALDISVRKLTNITENSPTDSTCCSCWNAFRKVSNEAPCLPPQAHTRTHSHDHQPQATHLDVWLVLDTCIPLFLSSSAWIDSIELKHPSSLDTSIALFLFPSYELIALR